MFWNIVILALVTWWISSAFMWDPWTVAIVVGGLYLVYELACHFKWFNMGPAVRAGAGGGGGGITAGTKKFLIFFSTLTFVMMVGTAVIGVSNNDAFTYFLALGPRPWLYPARVSTDLLIWVALFFLSLVIAALTANQRAKPAIWIFGITLAFLFTVREAPRLAEMARPKAATPMAVPSIPPPTTKWEEADQAASEGRGAAPVVLETAKKAIVGDHVAKRIVGYIGGAFRDVFPKPVPKPAPSPTVVYVPAPAPVEFPTSGEGHATKVGLKAYLDPTKTYTRPSGPARYTFVEDPSLFFDDVEGARVDRTVNRQFWQEMPAGKYIIYPLGRDDIFFRWYQ